jgi:PmbA protein
VTPELIEQARVAARLAARFGAQETKVGLTRSRGISVEWRDGRLERLQDRAQCALHLEVLVDQRYSSNGTNDLRPDALERFVRDAVEMTRLLEPDPHRGLVDPAYYPARDELALDLDVWDPTQARVETEQRIAAARELEELVRAQAGAAPIVSVSSRAGDGFSESVQLHSNGFEGVERGTSFSQSATVVLRQADGKRPTGSAYSVRRHGSDLEPRDKLAGEALERALEQLDSKKLATGRYTIVVENQCAGRLLGPLLGPLAGSALQQRRSLWDGKLGQRIASPLLTLFDEPRTPRSLGATLWDSDGMAARRRPLLEEGVLRTYLVDPYYARKLGWAPTGGSTHQLAWSHGTRGLDALIRGAGEGVLIQRFLGGNSNGTTGELSLGCGGRRIRGGERAEPLSEVNLAANIATLWTALAAVGNDPDPNSAAACPTCVFEGVQLSGV